MGGYVELKVAMQGYGWLSRGVGAYVDEQVAT
jgi:hypothetical protein